MSSANWRRHGTTKVRVRRHRSLVEGGGDRDHLGHRAGLVGVDGGKVAGRDLDLAVVVALRPRPSPARRRCRVSMTTTVPDLAPSSLTRPSSASSTANWIERSRVRMMSSPGTGCSRDLLAARGSSDPWAPPLWSSRPACRSGCRCSPAPPPPRRRRTAARGRTMPAPSMSVSPITLRPVSPPGSTRLSSGSTLTPLSSSCCDLLGRRRCRPGAGRTRSPCPWRPAPS